MSNKILFIDSRVQETAALLAGLATDVEVFYLSAHDNGLSQIAAVLSDRSGVDEVHIVSHGAVGMVQLGNLTLNSADVAAHSAELTTIGAALSSNGDIVLYGCETAAGTDGAALVQSLATLTGADVAASSDLTGAASLGGNWIMEVQSGTIEATLPFSAQALANFGETLATGTPLDLRPAGYYDINQGFATLSNGSKVAVYLHQVGGDNSYFSSYPDNVVKVTIANSANQIVQTFAIANAEYVQEAAVTTLQNGSFVVSWVKDNSPNHDLDIAYREAFYQIYNSAGVAQGAAEQIGNAGASRVTLTSLADGGFAAAYATSNDAVTLSVYGNNAGTFSLTNTSSIGGFGTTVPIDATNTLRISDNGSGNGTKPSVVQLSDGSIVVVSSTMVYYNTNYVPINPFAYKFTSSGLVDTFASGYSVTRLSWSMESHFDSGSHVVALSSGGFAVVNHGNFSFGNTISQPYELILLKNDGTPINAGVTVTHDVQGPGGNTSLSKTYAAQLIAVDTGNTSSIAGGTRFAVTEDSNGNVLVAIPSNDNTGYTIYTYDAAGASVGTAYDAGVAPSASGYILENPVLLPLAGGGFTMSYDEVSIDGNYVHTGSTYSYLYVPNTAPTFIGNTTSLDAAQNGVAIDLSTVLHVSDSDAGQTLTWSQSGPGPSHGTLSFSSATASSGGVNVAPGGSILYTPTAGYSGTDSFSVQVSDGVTTATRLITVKVAPVTPGKPVLDTASDSGSSHGDNLTNRATLSFSGTGAAGDSSSTVRVFIDVDGNGSYGGSDISGTATLSNGGWSVNGLSTSTLTDGTYHVYAVTSSATGSLTSSLSTALDVTIDKTAPNITFSALALSSDTGVIGDFITKVSAQTVSATLSAAPAAGDIIEGTVDGVTWIDISSMVSGTMLNWTGVVLNSSGTLQLRVTDQAGNSTVPYGHTYIVDTSVPAAPSTPVLSTTSDSGTLNNDLITSVNTPELTGTGENGATVTLYDDDGANLGTAVVANGMWSITSSVLAERSHNLTVKQTDVAGNVSTSSLALNVVIDRTAPTSIALSNGSATEAAATAGSTVATLLATDANAISYTLATGSSGNDASNGLFTIVGNALKPVSNLAAGTYHLYVDATDIAGNHSGQALTFVVGNGPSVVSIVRADAGGVEVVAGAASTISYAVTFSEAVTGVDASDFLLTTTGSASGSIVNPISGSGTTYTVTVNGLSGDGTLRLDLKSSGTGIQSGASVTINGGYTSGQTNTLDHTAPAAPSTPDLAFGDDSGGSQTDNITNVDQPSFSGTAESGSTVILYAGNTELGRTTATGGNWTIVPTAPLATGTHLITAKATDAAGNVSAASTTLSVVIDTAAPTGVALSATTAAVATSTAGATLATLSSSDDNAVTYALAVGNGTNNADNGSFSITGNSLKVGGAALSAGVYHIYLSATDAAGNVSYLAQTMTVQSIPVVTSIVRAGGASSGLAASATSADFTVTFSESVSGVDINDFVLTTGGNASGVISAISGSGTIYTITVNTLTGDGTLRLDLKSSGTGIQNGGSVAIGGGYTSGASYTLDHTAPSAPSVPLLASLDDSGISNSDNITNVTTPTFSGTAEAGSTVTLYEGNTVLGTAVASGGVWSITATTLTSGTHMLTVKTTDAAGNVSAASSALTLTVDTAAAAPAGLALASGSDSGVIGDGLTKFASPTITGIGEAYAAITLYDTDGTTVIGTTTAGASGAWTIVVNTTLSDGSHTLKAAQTDLAGNVSVLSTGLALTIDTQPPVAPGTPALDPASDTGTLGDNITQTTTPVIKGTAIANAAVTLYDTNGTTVLGTTTADNAGNWSITSSSLSVGAHTLTAKQQDAAGNESAASISLSLTIEAPPQPPTTPNQPTVIDGVPVQSQSTTLPGGGSGTQIVIPVVTPGRTETTGNASVADIPLATSGQGNILLAQLPAGFGLTSVGGVSQPAGDPLQQLIAAIVAATPGHTSGDQGHLTGNGVDFLSQLAQSTPLLVQTITPTATTTPSGTLTLTGTSSAVQRTALVIDTTHLPAGSKLALNAVDFAAIIGSADVSINSSGQVVTGDTANQTFTVATANNSSIFAGGGSDTLVFGQRTTAAAGAPLRAAAVGDSSTTLLHGGLDNDVAIFAGNQSDYIIQQHEGYLVIAAKAQPQQQALLINIESLKFADATVAVESRDAQTAIAGLYREVLGRQADYLGMDFWATAEKNGKSLGQIAIQIIESVESQSLNNGAFNGNAAHDVELLYQSIFGRHSEAAGLTFWTHLMDQGLSLESVANGFMHSAEMELHKVGIANWDFSLG
jgi:VCBS repeat-containing protein